MSRRRRYAIVGTGARAALYVDAITGPFRDAAELVGLCDVSQTRMDWHNRRLGRSSGVAPRPTYPAARFDAMVETARALSVELAADLFDERGSSWSSQRERYLREELIEYRHQFERR